LVIDEGDLFIKLGIEKLVVEFKERNIFKSVNYKVEEGSEKNLKRIKINVEECPSGEISGGGGVGIDGGRFVI
jgi:Outer membrane protein/protective antigen OMA87